MHNSGVAQLVERERETERETERERERERQRERQRQREIMLLSGLLPITTEVNIQTI